MTAFGPRTELTEIFATKGYPSCQQCKDLARRMNLWGCAICRREMDYLIADIRPRAKKSLAEEKPWAQKMFGAIDALTFGKIDSEDAVLSREIRKHVTRAIEAAEGKMPNQRTIIINADRHGIGDACITAWIAEGARGTDTRVAHYASGVKKELLTYFGHDPVPSPAGAITTFDAYNRVEVQQEHGSVPRVVSRARALGVQSEPKRPQLRGLPKAAEDWASQLHNDLTAHGRKPLVLLFPQSVYRTREWPASYWVDLAWHLKNHGAAPVILLDSRDERFTNVPHYWFGQPIANVLSLIRRADLVVANDSGPAHLAGTLDVPTLALLGPTKPTALSHMPSVECLAVPPALLSCIGCHFGAPFRAACDQGCLGLLRLFPEAVFKKVLERTQFGRHWSGLSKRFGDHGSQDLDVIGEVIECDGYFTRLRPTRGEGEVVVDVGAHIGSFAWKWHRKNPKARILCVEACPENVEILRRNVGGFAEVIHAACTYEEGELALLNSVKDGGTATGGSTVVRASELTEADTYGHPYWEDRRTLPTVTLEEIMGRLGVDRIDVLKLGCEGSEFSILGRTPSLDRIGQVLMEYHGLDRFQQLRTERFEGWDFGHMHASSDGLGIAHLVNPRGPHL